MTILPKRILLYHYEGFLSLAQHLLLSSFAAVINLGHPRTLTIAQAILSLNAMAKTSCLGLLWIVPLLSFPLLQSVSAQSFQLKSCFRWDGSASNNIPCNPEANVSACCGQGSTCRTNIFCENSSGLKIVGECTDRSWADPACPWRLSRFTSLVCNCTLLSMSTDAYKVQPAERIFSYQANTTMCSDGTLCPKTYPSTAENTTCCDAHQGKEEIVFRNKEKIPEDLSDLPGKYCMAPDITVHCLS